MTKPDIVFKPRYSGRAAFPLFFWPISAIGVIFFGVETIRSSAYYSMGLITLMFAVAAVSPSFIYFRALHFGNDLVVKRYFLPDVVIAYKDIISFQYFSLRSTTTRIALNNLNPKSYEELDQIMQQLIKSGQVKLKKR
jgi:hypothetical protein